MRTRLVPVGCFALVEKEGVERGWVVGVKGCSARVER